MPESEIHKKYFLKLAGTIFMALFGWAIAVDSARMAVIIAPGYDEHKLDKHSLR